MKLFLVKNGANKAAIAINFKLFAIMIWYKRLFNL